MVKKMEENIYKIPKSNLEITSDIGNTIFRNSKFKKTIIMNFVGGIGLAIISIFYVVTVFYSPKVPVLSSAIFSYLFMAFIAFASAYTIKIPTKNAFQLVMLILNWLCIVLFVLCVVTLLVNGYKDPKMKSIVWFSLPVFALFLLVPQVINILAFRKIRK